MSEKGHISIHADNILPIIKKWLYSEKEIFIRELVSNAVDAISKLDKLSTYGEVETEVADAKVTVAIDKDKKTLTISDTGLGLTDDEVKKYINQVAFSSLTDFVEKYKDKDIEENNIGHFGLGFYSAFMVADTVEIQSLSYKKDAKPVKWFCDGGTEFEISDGDRKEIGTSIILHISDDNKEMLEEAHIKSLLTRYCAFIKYPIELAGEVINDPNPLWNQSPSKLKDEDYLGFFKKMFPMSPDPLFWIHLNVDFPFKMKGILYFPKLQHELDASQGDVKLYCNQVFVDENTKELLPDWLTLLKGAIEIPDLPLNISRSYLQNDPQVKKIESHIVKKVADKISGLYKTERETFDKYWDDIHGFVKFGMIRDTSFYDRMIDFLVYKTSNGDYVTLSEYLDKMKDKTDGNIIYATDKSLQSTYIKMFKDHGIDVLIADTMIDSHLIPQIEMRSSFKFKFKRIDSDLSHLFSEKTDDDKAVSEEVKASTGKISELFTKLLAKDKLKIKVENLKSTSVPAMIIVDENMRRMKEMAQMGAMGGFVPPMENDETLVVNAKNSAIQKLLTLSSQEDKKDEAKLMVDQIYDLASIQQGALPPEKMQAFIDRSVDILQKL